MAKGIANTVADVLVSPFVLCYAIASRLRPGSADLIFQGYSHLFSLWPGVSGVYLRRAFYRFTTTRCPRSCSIGFGTVFATPEVDIGDGVYVGVNCNIGHATIGRDTLIGSNVTILSGKHQHHIDRLDVPIRHQGGTYTRVTIGDDVWLGNACIIMDDVESQAVVAAGAVVTRRVTSRAIVGGNPARVIGRRGERGSGEGAGVG